MSLPVLGLDENVGEALSRFLVQDQAVCLQTWVLSTIGTFYPDLSFAEQRPWQLHCANLVILARPTGNIILVCQIRRYRGLNGKSLRSAATNLAKTSIQ